MRQFAAEPVEDCAPAEQDRRRDPRAVRNVTTRSSVFREQFELDMTRQFSFVDGDGEYDHMAQLNCTFDFEPVDELRAAAVDMVPADAGLGRGWTAVFGASQRTSWRLVCASLAVTRAGGGSRLYDHRS